MDAKRILAFLRQVMANNDRQWFQAHKAEYEAVRAAKPMMDFMNAVIDDYE